MECRAVIKFLVGEGVPSNEIHTRLVKVYGTSSPSLSAVKKLASEFKQGRTNCNDVPREGRAKIAIEPEVVEQVHRLVMANERIKVRDIAKTIGISAERVGYILHEELRLSRVGPKWVQGDS